MGIKSSYFSPIPLPYIPLPDFPIRPPAPKYETCRSVEKIAFRQGSGAKRQMIIRKFVSAITPEPKTSLATLICYPLSTVQ
jgi:hypothetical protein